MDTIDLYVEIRTLRSLVDENQTSLDVLSMVKNSNRSFPSIKYVALRILLQSLRPARKEVFLI